MSSLAAVAHSSNLIHGSNVLSNRLKIFLNPMGFLFRFDSSQPPKRKPIKSLVLLLMALCLFLVIVSNYLVLDSFRLPREIAEAPQSPFLNWLTKSYIFYRVLMIAAAFLITFGQQASIAGILSNSANMISRRKQASLAGNSFYVHSFRCFTKCFLLFPIFWSQPTLLVVLLSVFMIMDMAISTPLMYTCYLASASSEHVKNFSRVYVDSMFDQFMRALEQENQNSMRRPSGSSLGGGSSTLSRYSSTEANGPPKIGFFRRIVRGIKSTVRRFVRLLKSSKYHELPEMKMTKLSSSNKITISATIRNTNCDLIKSRLRKTQIMLCELRDVVQDINKMSSPITMIEIVHDAFIVVLVTTGSIHLKFYRTVNGLILVTIGAVLNLTIQVYYTCTCLDRTVSELKLMINKLFDFIIMNHSDDEASRHDSIRKSGSGSLTETWTQFQYTRQLAGTIHFYMAGILPVSRRLVLSILAHVLSAVFIAIEVMSIVDTTVSATGKH